ncbi:hypothetical protein QZH41_003132 [Actinostola sp. cb2023]|nr:hypothetical protein QZH41_003132 [Actinostola sp. cb2023]
MTGVSIWGLCCLPQKRAETISKIIAAVLDKSEFCDHKNSTSKVSSTTNESSIGKPDMKFCKYVDIFIVDNIVCSLQFSFQAVFIVNALRRRVEEISLANPFSLGVIRNVSAILSLANFGIWAMDTFELKDIKTVGSIETVAYSPSTWRILVHIAYPLCIFFRLHSAFCFFEVVINRFGVTAKPRGYQSIRRLRSGSESVTL